MTSGILRRVVVEVTRFHRFLSSEVPVIYSCAVIVVYRFLVIWSGTIYVVQSVVMSMCSCHALGTQLVTFALKLQIFNLSA